MSYLPVFILGAVLAIIVGLDARRRTWAEGALGPAGWFIATVFFGILTVPVYIYWRRSSVPAKSKVCPACAEEVKVEARVCKHCGHGFAAAQPA